MIARRDRRLQRGEQGALLFRDFEQDAIAPGDRERLDLAQLVEHGGIRHRLVQVGRAHVLFELGAQHERREAQQEAALDALVAGRAQAVLSVLGLEGVEELLGHVACAIVEQDGFGGLLRRLPAPREHERVARARRGGGDPVWLWRGDHAPALFEHAQTGGAGACVLGDPCAGVAPVAEGLAGSLLRETEDMLLEAKDAIRATAGVEEEVRRELGAVLLPDVRDVPKRRAFAEEYVAGGPEAGRRSRASSPTASKSAS